MERPDAGRNGLQERKGWRDRLRLRWLVLLVPFLVYGAAIGWAYWRPPLVVPGRRSCRNASRRGKG